MFHQIFLHLVGNIFAFQEGNIFAFQEGNIFACWLIQLAFLPQKFVLNWDVGSTNVQINVKTVL